MEEVLKNAKNIVFIKCNKIKFSYPSQNIYYNNELIRFWSHLAMKYIPIKNQIQRESKYKIHKLFKNSNNVLGVKIRGTEYVAMKPKYHPIPPALEVAIKDVKNLDLKNYYDWIFISSEDNKIKEGFINEFKNKIRFLNSKTKVNYKGKNFFVRSKEVLGNIEYAKNYVMNIYILSKCTDLVMSRGSGSVGVILFANGFRNSLIYNLGVY